MDIKQLAKTLSAHELKQLNVAFQQKNQSLPRYYYSSIQFSDLRKLFSLKFNIQQSIFKKWFETDFSVSQSDIDFFKEIINDHSFLIESYKEEDLKVKVITPILNRVKFIDVDIPFRDFYEENLTYKTDKFILSGDTDFLISKGLEYAEKPYFFIQEFKKSIKNDDPRPQLLAELIAGVELNGTDFIRGAYIVGSIWNFVILEKLAVDSYQYFISTNFDSSKLDDLTAIYKTLQFVKNEIIVNSLK